MIYRFGTYSLDPERLELSENNKLISVEPQVFALLAFLIKHRDKVVTKDEIINEVWDGRIVSDGTLNSRINAARRALGDDGKEKKFIKTFPRRGFRFVVQLNSDKNIEPAQTDHAQLSEKPSIVVLPFLNLSGDAEQEYFADGITEDVITALGRIRYFFVIARNTAFTFKGQSVSVTAISEDLDVRYVLEGSVRKSGHRVRINVQLNYGPSGSHIWAETYDRQFEDIFKLQDEITQAVIAAIEPTLLKVERDQVIGKKPENLDAWDYYHKGISHMYDRGAYGQPDEMVCAKENFAKAIELDGKFTRAYGALSQCLFVTAIMGPWNNLYVTLEEACDAAKKAVEFDQHDAEAHSVMGGIYGWKRDPEASVRESLTALEIDPTFSRAHSWLGQAKIWSGNAVEGSNNIEEFLSVGHRDPHRGAASAWLSIGYSFSGQFEKAEEMARRSLAIPYTQYWGNIALTASLSLQEKFEEALETVKVLRKRRPELTCSLMDEFAPITHLEYRTLLVDGLRKAVLPEE